MSVITQNGSPGSLLFSNGTRNPVGTPDLSYDLSTGLLTGGTQGIVSYRNQAGFIRPPGYVSGRRYGPLAAATTSTVSTANNTIDWCLVYVGLPTIFTGIASFPTVAVTISAHFGIYDATAAGGMPGALIAGSDVTISTLTAAAENVASFSSAITLQPGFYWLAKLGNGSATFTAISASNGMMGLGVAALLTSASSVGVKVTSSQAFGSLPSTAPSASFSEGASSIILALVAQ